MTKANNGKGNNIDRDDWQTPQKLWEKLDMQYKFTFDCCATDNNTKCFQYSSDFLNKKCIGNICWMNPPFSKAYEMFIHFFDVVIRGVAIYRIDNIETKIWQMILKKADWVHIFPKRINYEGHKGKGSRFGSALIGIGLEKPKDIEGITIKKCV